MSIKATAANYWELSNKIYDDEYLTSNKTFYTQESVTNPTQDIINNHNWKTVTSIDDQNSNLQAAMVVPADEYNDVVYHHKRPLQAIFVSRGTSSSKDWEANLNELAKEQNANINQFQVGDYTCG